MTASASAHFTHAPLAEYRKALFGSRSLEPLQGTWEIESSWPKSQFVLYANEECSDDGPFHDGGDIRGPVVAGAERLQKWARRSASRQKARVASLKPR